MTTRIKAVETSIRTVDEADLMLQEIALLENKKREVDNWATKEEHEIREQAKKKLVLDKSTGETVDDRIAAMQSNLLAFVEKIKDTFSTGKRSMELPHGMLGFRLGTPKVDTVGKITQKAIMATEALVKKLNAWGFIDLKPRLDKEAILSAFGDDSIKTLSKLRQVSLTVTQNDEPWIESRRVEMSLAVGKKTQAA